MNTPAKILVWFCITALLLAAFLFMPGRILAAEITGRVLINSEPAERAVAYLTNTDGRPLSPTPVEKTIRQENIRFKPEFLIVPAGSAIRFENHDDEIHNIYSKTAENRFDTGAHVPRTVKTVMLKNPGAVPIRCRTHATMRGTTAREQTKLPLRLRSTTKSQSSSVMFWMSPSRA